MSLLLALGALLALAPSARSLVFASPTTEPRTEVPPDFPYWEHVTQRRYEGPTVLYLGGGYALTARHVGMGEIALDGVMYKPARGSKRSLLNETGSAADAMIFELDPEAGLPDLPILPIAREALRPGEEVLVVGFGRGREKVIEFELDGRIEFGFTWTAKGQKRWGTNRIESNFEILNQGSYSTRALTFRFDEPLSPQATRYETHAAVGDSGGGVFVERDGQWQLAGLMISVAGDARMPGSSTLYGDLTYAADLTYYRDELLRWTRPACMNERDDDGDERIDFPLDPGCDSPLDRNEWEGDAFAGRSFWLATLATLSIGCALAYLVWRMRNDQRGTTTPSSRSPSNAD